MQDTRHALRRLRMAPAFTIATVLTLALGIGATTSIFTLVHAVLLKSLPVANPGDLYRLGRDAVAATWAATARTKSSRSSRTISTSTCRDNTTGFADLAAFPSVQQLFGVRRVGAARRSPQSYPGEFVSGNYFAMFGIRPYAGRLLDADGRSNRARRRWR